MGEIFRDPRDFGDFLRCGFADAGDGAEFFQEQGFAAGGHAGAVVEGAFFHAAAVEEFVIAVGEAVGFVADALEEFEGSAVVGDEERFGFAGKEDFLALFGEADDGNFLKAECAELFQRAGELAFSAVDDDEIRQDDFGFAFPSESALDIDEGFL